MEKKEIIINCLADTTITIHAISNHLSFCFSNDLDVSFEHLKPFNVSLHVRSIFGRISRDSQYNSISTEKIIARDNGLNMLRSMLKYDIDFKFIDSYGIREEFSELIIISPAIYNKCVSKIINE